MLPSRHLDINRLIENQFTEDFRKKIGLIPQSIKTQLVERNQKSARWIWISSDEKCNVADRNCENANSIFFVPFNNIQSAFSGFSSFNNMKSFCTSVRKIVLSLIYKKAVSGLLSLMSTLLESISNKLNLNKTLEIYHLKYIRKVFHFPKTGTFVEMM